MGLRRRAQESLSGPATPSEMGPHHWACHLERCANMGRVDLLASRQPLYRAPWLQYYASGFMILCIVLNFLFRKVLCTFWQPKEIIPVEPEKLVLLLHNETHQ